MGSPRVVFVDVQVDSISPLRFRVEPSEKNKPQLPTGPDGEIIFQNEGHRGFEIHFELQGNTRGYFFPPKSKKHEAVWSRSGDDCPDSGAWEVLHPTQVIESGKPPERRTLIVNNPNPSPAQGKFQYNLRLTNGSDWKDLDPGGDNRNGSYGSGINYFAIGGVALAAGALISLAATAALTKLDLKRSR